MSDQQHPDGPPRLHAASPEVPATPRRGARVTEATTPDEWRRFLQAAPPQVRRFFLSSVMTGESRSAIGGQDELR